MIVVGVDGRRRELDPRPTSWRPRARLLTGAVDDYVVRVVLPGGVVHDCTAGQAAEFATELAEVAAAAERAAQQRGRSGR